jgi:SPP1 family predicted phage head-tail adaptor
VQERVDDVSSVDGSVTPTWVTVASVYARVEPMSGREFRAAQATQGETLTTFTLRHVAGLTVKHRLLFDGRVYNIRAVLAQDERGAVMRVVAAEGVNNG